MPIPKLKITDSVRGLPRQLVPLRLAALITDLGPDGILTLLRPAGVYGDATINPLLEGHKLQGNQLCTVRAVDYELMAQSMQSSNAKALMNRLPSDDFVWSDELASAFSAHIDLTIDRDDALLAGMQLIWNPVIPASLKSDMDACAQVPGQMRVTSLQNKAKRKKNTNARHEAIFKKYQQLKKTHPHLSVSDIAKRLAKDPVAARPNGTQLSPQSVRRIITSMK